MYQFMSISRSSRRRIIIKMQLRNGEVEKAKTFIIQLASRGCGYGADENSYQEIQECNLHKQAPPRSWLDLCVRKTAISLLRKFVRDNVQQRSEEAKKPSKTSSSDARRRDKEMSNKASRGCENENIRSQPAMRGNRHFANFEQKRNV